MHDEILAREDQNFVERTVIPSRTARQTAHDRNETQLRAVVKRAQNHEGRVETGAKGKRGSQEGIESTDHA